MTNDSRSIQLTGATVDALFPLHVTISGRGLIESVGPTLARIAGRDLIGRRFLDAFKIERPRGVADLDALRAQARRKLVISAWPQDGAPVQFRCVAAPLGHDNAGLFVDFSLGADFADVIERFSLASRDFKPNDVSIDLVYAVETQKTLLEDSRRLASALNHAKDEAERVARVDVVTGIANRRALHARLDEMLSGSEGDGAFALLHVDLDRFKAVNDSFGHAAGDFVLKHAASAIANAARDRDLAARIGGDEFVLLLADAPDDQNLVRLAEALCAHISRPVRLEEAVCEVGASIGVVRFAAGEETSADKLLAKSDIALYDAKERGVATTLMTPQIMHRHAELARLTADIERGVECCEFVPYFQPQIDAMDMTLRGFEVLARWDHPENGVLAPGLFMEAATRAQLMDTIDREVRRSAFRAFSEWSQAGWEFGKLSLNMTGSNLRSADFLGELTTELEAIGLCSERIQLELLESILFDKSDPLLLKRCEDLKAAGFSLALDDFGTGYASISILLDAPISLLKINRSFVSGVDRNLKLQRITGAMLSMARQIGLEVLAEGVETEWELEFLRQNGCRSFQGFYFSRPMPRQQVVEFARSFDSCARPLLEA